MTPGSAPTPAHTVAQGYGNIYTPHAGSMVIQVQRELGLANRTIVLSPRKVRLLRFFTSRFGIFLALMLAASWVVLAVQAVRVPLLTNRLKHLEHTAQRLDSLETTLSQLQSRYNQVQRLMGTSATQSQQQQATSTPATSGPGATAASSQPAPQPAPQTAPQAAPRAVPQGAPRYSAPITPQKSSQAPAPVLAPPPPAVTSPPTSSPQSPAPAAQSPQQPPQH